jgi:hypothetical protein
VHHAVGKEEICSRRRLRISTLRHPLLPYTGPLWLQPRKISYFFLIDAHLGFGKVEVIVLKAFVFTDKDRQINQKRIKNL